MQTKLTLRLDDKLIRRAKKHAENAGKSLSQVVAEYFTLIGSTQTTSTSELSPTVKRLKGSLKLNDLGREDYREYLAEKNQ